MSRGDRQGRAWCWREDVEINSFVCRFAVIPCSCYWLYIFGVGRPSWLAPEGAAVCARASYGPGAGLSPRATRGVRNARLGGSIIRETMSFLPILILMQGYLSLAVWRLKFVEIELLGLRLWAIGSTLS